MGADREARGPGGGFVVFNNTAGPDNLQVTVALKGVMPATAYRIYLFIDQVNLSVGGIGTPSGTVMTDLYGNATYHFDEAVTPGVHKLGVDVVFATPFTGADVYLTSGFYPNLTTTLTFE